MRLWLSPLTLPALLERLTERARAEGVTRFSGVVLAENEEAIGLLERHAAGAEVRFEIVSPLVTTPAPRCASFCARWPRPAGPGARTAT